MENNKMFNRTKKTAAYLVVLSIIPAIILTALWVDDIYFFFLQFHKWFWVLGIFLLAGLGTLFYAFIATRKYSIEHHGMSEAGATIFSVLIVFLIALLFISLNLALNKQ
jgi:branched-subunit amino acid transport protein